jgi:hypothetical protein
MVAHDHDDEDRKQQIGREGGEELRRQIVEQPLSLLGVVARLGTTLRVLRRADAWTAVPRRCAPCGPGNVPDRTLPRSCREPHSSTESCSINSVSVAMQNRSKLAVTFSQAVSMPDATSPADMPSFFMALPFFEDSSPRAYRLKAATPPPLTQQASGHSPDRAVGPLDGGAWLPERPNCSWAIPCRRPAA